jgi:hypothetical protein
MAEREREASIRYPTESALSSSSFPLSGNNSLFKSAGYRDDKAFESIKHQLESLSKNQFVHIRLITSSQIHPGKNRPDHNIIHGRNR